MSATCGARSSLATLTRIRPLRTHFLLLPVPRSQLPEQPRPVLDVSSGEHTPFGEASAGVPVPGAAITEPQAGGLGDRNVQVLTVWRPEYRGAQLLPPRALQEAASPQPHPAPHHCWRSLGFAGFISHLCPVSTRLLPVCQSVSKPPLFVRTPGLFD